MTQFKPGNQLWRRRLTTGAPRKYETADDLQTEIIGYFEWLENNPLLEQKAFQFQGEIITTDVPKMRAATLVGLCLYVGISRKTWLDWKANRPDLLNIMETAEEGIYNQKFEGASAGLLKENIIARELGLADKQDTNHSGNVSLSDLSEDELQARLDKYNRKAQEGQS